MPDMSWTRNTLGTRLTLMYINVHDAIRECLIVRSERGMPLTIETHQVEVVA